jgi:surface polysaccharide O-acyltransferase-like enzyme
MISGALLLGRSEPIWQFLMRRFLKVGVPAIFWSVIYLVWATEAYRDGSMLPLRILLSILKAIYLGDVEIHLWFLYILIGIYLVVPILRLFISAASRNDLKYFLLLWLISTPLIELSGRLSGFPTAFSIPVVAGYVGYFVMGYVLAETEMNRTRRILAICGVAVAVAVTYVGTAVLSRNVEAIDAFLYSYFSLPSVLASFCGFLLLKDAGQNLGKIGNVVRMVSAHSFGIFLIHIWVIDLLRKGAFGFRLYSWMAHPSYMIPLVGLIVYVVSFAIVYLLRRVPVVRMLVP